MEQIVMTVVVLLLSAVVHEYAHGWVALRLGDTTARDAGRLTLNPLRHIDPVGSIVVPLLLVLSSGMLLAWARPVPVRADRMRDPVAGQASVAAAGPGSNLLLALLSAVLWGLLVGSMRANPGLAEVPGVNLLELFLRVGILANVWLAVINALPVPPLDGSWILARYLPAALRARYLALGRYGFLLMLGLLVVLRFSDATVLGDVIGRVMAPFFALAGAVAGLLA
ncbi:MAG: site-2 protease family protein [Candidatus Krumholzibacteriia bacterium]